MRRRALLAFGEAGEHDDWHLGNPEPLGGLQAAVASDQPAIRRDEQRCGPAELADRGRDLIDLQGGVLAGVSLVAGDPADRPGLDLQDR
jgi:hypothetical protein